MPKRNPDVPKFDPLPYGFVDTMLRKDFYIAQVYKEDLINCLQIKLSDKKEVLDRLAIGLRSHKHTYLSSEEILACLDDKDKNIEDLVKKSFVEVYQSYKETHSSLQNILYDTLSKDFDIKSIDDAVRLGSEKLLFWLLSHIQRHHIDSGSFANIDIKHIIGSVGFRPLDAEAKKTSLADAIINRLLSYSNKGTTTTAIKNEIQQRGLHMAMNNRGLHTKDFRNMFSGYTLDYYLEGQERPKDINVDDIKKIESLCGLANINKPQEQQNYLDDFRIKLEKQEITSALALIKFGVANFYNTFGTGPLHRVLQDYSFNNVSISKLLEFAKKGYDRDIHIEIKNILHNMSIPIHDRKDLEDCPANFFAGYIKEYMVGCVLGTEWRVQFGKKNITKNVMLAIGDTLGGRYKSYEQLPHTDEDLVYFVEKKSKSIDTISDSIKRIGYYVDILDKHRDHMSIVGNQIQRYSSYLENPSYAFTCAKNVCDEIEALCTKISSDQNKSPHLLWSINGLDRNNIVLILQKRSDIIQKSYTDNQIGFIKNYNDMVIGPLDDIIGYLSYLHNSLEETYENLSGSTSKRKRTDFPRGPRKKNTGS